MMAKSKDRTSYLTAKELARLSGFSVATIWRLKRDEKIPFVQPGGKHGKVVFPEDALERANPSTNPIAPVLNDKSDEPLPGRRPDWMSSDGEEAH
ncbi:Helix-turn-helix domain protein [Planctomycetes bacterium Pan216]|uniref:Helix-turn-helix domain protein n=1 Tax=Kolteria novifilia TaxID=2527975 RepID=A0A518B460_9BACT|nr:Helix-turn-helix domain protein [Planctomycetes bacterium Pan216]